MRQPPGIAWTELQIRRWQAMQTDAEANAERITALAFAAQVLEFEFPEAIAFERELWGEAAWLKQEGEKHADADTTTAISVDPTAERSRAL